MAFLLVIAVFSFWSIVGFAIVSALWTRRNLLQNALLAPSTGLAATAVLVASTSGLNVPLKYGGPVVTGILLVITWYCLRRSRVVIPLRRLAPFAAALALAAVVVGYPMFVFGFDWLSYGNDDMTNYCLGAKFFLNHRQYSVPSILAGDADASLLYWAFYVVDAVRHGVEQLLAWILSMTGLSAHQAFMPLIVSFNLTLISSASALVMQGRKYRSAALLTCFALALSALTTLGTEYQLFAQVAGLAMLASVATVLLRPVTFRRPQLLFAALQVSGAAMIYPEVTPFLALSFVLYHSVAIIRGQERLGTLLKNTGTTIACAALLLNASIGVLVLTLLGQTAVGTTSFSPEGTLFPYYLTPSAFAYLWGFRAIGQTETGLTVDVGVVFGAILFISVAAASVWFAWNRKPVACCFLVMWLVSLQLFRMQLDFGLYKIAMYMQPFLLGTLSVGFVWAFRRWSNRYRRIALVGVTCVVIGWGCRAQFRYVILSLGEKAGGGFMEIPFASRRRLTSELKRAFEGRSPMALLSTTPNVILAKIISYYGGDLYFPTRDVFDKVGEVGSVPYPNWNPYYLAFGRSLRGLNAERQARFHKAWFDMHGSLPSNEFAVRRDISARNLPILRDGIQLDVLNRLGHAGMRDAVEISPAGSLSNYLIQVKSGLGNTFTAPRADRAAGRVSFYQLEPDYFFAERTMASIGRVSLFNILNPSGHVRMFLEYSASLNADGRNAIPDVSVIGSERVRLHTLGRGSARLISAIVEPQNIYNDDYLALDMGTWGQPFPQRRSWIMSLWGTRIRVDGRRITGFARDVSLISDEEYADMKVPAAIQLFPDDLKDKNLEYSGIYEDGWIAESSYAVLYAPQDSSTLVVLLSVPTLQGGRPPMATLTVDDKEVASQATSTGSVSFKVRIQGRGRRRIGLLFGRATGLPYPDERPVSAQVRYMGFESEGSQARREN